MTEIINTAFYQTKNSSPGVLNTSMTLKERMESLKKDLAEKVTSAETKEARHEALKNAFNKHAEYLKPASSRVNYLRKFFEEKIINIDDPEQREKEKKEAFTGDDVFVKFNKSFFTAITNKQNILIKTPSFEGDNWSILDDEERW